MASSVLLDIRLPPFSGCRDQIRSMLYRFSQPGASCHVGESGFVIGAGYSPRSSSPGPNLALRSGTPEVPIMPHPGLLEGGGTSLRTGAESHSPHELSRCPPPLPGTLSISLSCQWSDSRFLRMLRHPQDAERTSEGPDLPLVFLFEGPAFLSLQDPVPYVKYPCGTGIPRDGKDKGGGFR